MTPTAALPTAAHRYQFPEAEIRLRAIAAAVVAGDLDEDAGRESTIEEFHRIGLARHTIENYRRYQIYPQLLRDVVETAEEWLYRAVTTHDISGHARNDEPLAYTYNFATIVAGASPIGWARTGLENEVRKFIRDTQRRGLNRDETILTEFSVPSTDEGRRPPRVRGFTVNDKVEISQAVLALKAEEALRRQASQGDASETWDAVDAVTVGARGIPVVERNELHARALVAAFGLPEPERPLHRTRREAILAILEADPEAAYRSLVGGYRNAVVDERAEALLSVWGTYCAGDAEKILTTGWPVGCAQVIARYALSTYRPPSRSAARAFAAAVRTACVGAGLPVDVGSDLARAYLASECDSGESDLDWPDVAHPHREALAATFGAGLTAIRDHLRHLLDVATETATRR